MLNVPIQDLEALKLRLSTGASLAETDTTIILSILNVYQWMFVQLGVLTPIGKKIDKVAFFIPVL